MNVGKKIARNSMWYGLEVGLGAVVMLGTSVLLSRHYGPQRLAGYIYLVWLTYVAGMLSAVGLPAAAQRFMAEYLGKGEPGVAYRVFWVCFKAQAIIVTGVIAAGVALVWYTQPSGNFWIGFWLVLGIAPRMLGFIPSQINAVIEDMSRNIPAMLASQFVTLGIVLASVWLGWDMLGLAISHPAGHTTDLLLKMFATARERRQWKQHAGATGALAPDISGRLRRFAVQGLGLMVLNVVVWDRSDVVLLRFLSHDASQVTFFSYSFTLVEKLLMVSQVVGMAMGLNVLSQFVKDRKRGVSAAVSSAYFLLLVGLPILVGAAALSRSLWAIYGDKFTAGVSVFTIMAVLAAPRIVLQPANALLLASEKQAFLLWWGVLCGVANLGLDVLLIPAYGAVGAAIGNGTGQALAACGAWTYVIRQFSADVKIGLLSRVAVSALTMGTLVLLVNRSLPPLPGAIAGVPVGVVAYLVMLRLTRAVGESDRDRLVLLAKGVPAILRSPLNRILWSLVPKAV
jgi:O-antigen/teichoic acid export membrane protein